MEKLIFDTGIKSYEFGSGILRFNPSDPNVYARFIEAVERIKAIEQEFVAQADALPKATEEADRYNIGAETLRLLSAMDHKVKEELNSVFVGNDFDRLLSGVNLLAVAGNGERVITNVIAALSPIMQEGAEACANGAVEEAKLNREQRRAAQKM